MKAELEQILLQSRNKDEIISYLKYHPHEFEEVIHLTVSDELHSWRPIWLLWSCMKNNDARLQKHIKEFIRIIPDRKDGQQRELLKILNRMELSEEDEGMLLDICIKIWENNKAKPSTRYNALKCIFKLARKYPDLANEVLFLTDSRYIDSLSSGTKKSVLGMRTDFMNLQKKD